MGLFPIDLSKHSGKKEEEKKPQSMDYFFIVKEADTQKLHIKHWIFFHSGTEQVAL